MLSPDFQRIVRIKDYCVEIETTVKRYGRAFEIFDVDRDFQRSISFSILQIGELVGGLSLEFRTATQDRIPWNRIKGMRNIVAHDYGDVDLETVWHTAINSIPELQTFCEELLSANPN